MINEGEGVGGGASSGAMRDLDINRVPFVGGGGGEECMEYEEDESPTGSGGGPPRKKLRLTKEQSRLLEESFRQNHTLNPVSQNQLYIDSIYYYFSFCTSFTPYNFPKHYPL